MSRIAPEVIIYPTSVIARFIWNKKRLLVAQPIHGLPAMIMIYYYIILLHAFIEVKNKTRFFLTFILHVQFYKNT